MVAVIIALLAGWQFGAYVAGQPYHAGPLYVVEAERLRFIWQVQILDGNTWNWFAQSVIELLLLVLVLVVINSAKGMVRHQA